MRDVAEPTARLIDGDGMPILLEDEPAAAILFVGSTTEPGPDEFGRRTGLRINGADAVNHTHPPGRAEIRDSAVRDVTPYTRPLRQARLRVEELATANRRKDEFLAMLSHP